MVMKNLSQTIHSSYMPLLNFHIYLSNIAIYFIKHAKHKIDY
jgi:hypothetical protein